jgi:hypothetical protein
MSRVEIQGPAIAIIIEPGISTPKLIGTGIELGSVEWVEFANWIATEPVLRRIVEIALHVKDGEDWLERLYELEPDDEDEN